MPTAIPAPSRNDSAVVILIRIGDVQLLLGSDLEETASPTTGWTAIVNSTTRPEGRSSVFKIPHHGSSNADQPRVWTDMLNPGPFAIITPFERGSVKLPTETDIKRTISRTNSAYQTATLKRTQYNRRSGTVDKAIKQTVHSIREIGGTIGHVRLRKKIDASQNWTVALFGDAHKILV
jgi:beta-lactamase superfamily II metal-dependent hydrolase